MQITEVNVKTGKLVVRPLTAAEIAELPAPAAVQVQVDQVPRYCGVMALKRHRLVLGELQELADEEGDAPDSLHALVLALRDSVPPSKARDDLDAALTQVLHWLRTSPTVEAMRTALTLTQAQVDALFHWAKAYEASI